MPPWLNAILSNPRLIIALLVVLGPVLGRIIKVSSEAARKRREAIERDRRQLEGLRTGAMPQPEERAPTLSTPAQSPTPRTATTARQELEQMAARRRAQIEAARAARLGAPPRPNPTPPAPTVQPAPRPVASVQPGPGVQTVQLPGGFVLEVPRAEPQQPSPQRRQDRRQRPAKAQTPQAPAPPATPSVPPTPVVSPSRRAPTSARRLLTGPRGALSALDLRRAVIMQEILGPPVSSRM